MPVPGDAVSIEEQIDRWRSYLRRRQAIHSVDVAELEDHLREQIAVLVDAGLAPDEAFLMAVKRMGNIVAFCLAVAAAVFIKVPALFGIHLDQDAGFYARNLSLFALPLLTGYFAWKRRLETSTIRGLAVAFVAAGVFANVYPFAPGGSPPGPSGPPPPLS